MAEPFMEHPSGEFDTAIDAMADAIDRLRKLPNWGSWITFCAQGAGNRSDSYHLAEIRLRADSLEVDLPLSPDAVTQEADVPSHCLEKLGTTYSVAKASPEEAALIADAIFRHHLGIRPHDGEGEDYAVGAEWVAG
ncbi:MAG: hypothetical protein QM811_13030 [Pirellulales bacterium]